MLEDTEHLIKIVLLIIAPGGGLLFAAWKLFVKASKARERWEGIPDRIRIIADQIVPNGGHSLRDAVDRIEARLWWVDARARALTEDSDLGVCETDKEGKWTWVNRTYLRVTGVGAGAARGWGWLSQIHPEDRERVEGGWKHAVSHRIEFADTYRLVEATEGRIIKVRARAYPMRGARDQLTGWVCLIEPLTDDA